ncbi:hypothetical protein Hypma_002742 [Hypsizygus marmoreus]|uniref:F-box domain-containing protein n=1 Tax=Hypsizygus marmoreus TaxID=39966 RepID=A0A369J3L5_HYPMA|nr:hypothetical protein Hypma_002742 [Hypsizygus marmoreus]
MSHPSVFSLPLELLEEIADEVHLDTQLSLCRVSKLFHSLTIRSVYRVIFLDSPALVVACCRTLASNRTAALSVRQLAITYTPMEPPRFYYFSSFYALIGKALQNLSQLHELKLMVSDPAYIRTLNRAHFPFLRHFECYLALTDSLILFLNRHPTINYLQIAPTEAFVQTSVVDSSRPPLQVVLPKLQYFIGNSECISALVPDASLRAAFIFWEAAYSTPQDTIRSLEHSSGDTINLVSCRRRGWNLDLIDLISISLPNIYVLIITNLLVVDVRPSEAYLNAVKNMLSRFSMLRNLHLHCIDTWNMNDVKCNMDEDFATVTAWGSACPSLLECILPHSNGMKWIRIHDLWLPDPNSEQGMEWTWDMLCSNGHPQWNRLLVDIEARLRRKAVYARGVEEAISVLRSLTLQSASGDDVHDREENDVVDSGRAVGGGGSDPPRSIVL